MFRLRHASILLLAVALLPGCSSTGYKKSDAAASRLHEAAGAVQLESRNLEATMTALNDMTNSPSGDLRPQFQRFSSALDGLISSSKHSRGSTTNLDKKRAAYFEAWDKELVKTNDPEIRKRGQARQAEVSQQFDSTTRRYREAQDALVPLVGYLQDIRKALSADLTSAGLQSAKPSISSANEQAAKVQPQLTQSAADLDALSASMSSSGSHPAK